MPEAFGKGLTKIDLEVFSSNQAAIALYRRYGFTIEGRRRKARHVDGIWDDIILMALEPGVVPANNPIIDRIERQAATPGLAAILANLSAPDLQSLLLEVYRQQAARRTHAAILAEHSRNRFTRPSQGSARAFATLERLAHENLPPDFEALELSPVCPLAACSAVAAVGQDWSVATILNTEVVSDPTNVLALECALRRKSSAAAVSLAATHRVLRLRSSLAPVWSRTFEFSCWLAQGETKATGALRSANSLAMPPSTCASSAPSVMRDCRFGLP